MAKQDATSKSRGASGAARDGDPGQGAHEGVLADLIEVEQRLRAAVRAAEDEAARAIAAAEAEVRARAEAHDNALDRARRELVARLALERDAGLAEIAQQSEETVRHLREPGEARVRDVARQVALRIAEGDPEL